MRYTASQSACPVRRGAVAAELALWLPFLGLMFVLALDFCRVFYYSQTIQNCAAAAAMYASGNASRNPSIATDSDAAVQAAVAEGASLSPPLTAANVAVTYAGGQAIVTVTYSFQLLLQLPGSSGTLTIIRSVQMNMAPTPG